ncbi:MAG: hypothetical protein RBS39_03340 [Phycisphaerales bacterium]|jgi:hypothetical protein|nr:hypothetical protein [Phycisphaerales bacterium]
MVATRDDVVAQDATLGLFEGEAGVNLFERAAARCGSVAVLPREEIVRADVGPSPDDSMAGAEIEPVSRDAVGEDDRSRLLGEIVDLNPTATSVFLSLFSDAQLAEYRDHLIVTREPRGRVARWERRASTPAIVWRDADNGSRRVRGSAA